MPKMTSRIIPAPQELAKMVKIKRKDDFYVLRTKNLPHDQVFFMRDPDGSTNVVWSSDDLEVKSFGSAKERRALFAKVDKENRKAASSRKRR
jgi:hypothetical protein